MINFHLEIIVWLIIMLLVSLIQLSQVFQILVKWFLMTINLLKTLRLALANKRKLLFNLLKKLRVWLVQSVWTLSLDAESHYADIHSAINASLSALLEGKNALNVGKPSGEKCYNYLSWLTTQSKWWFSQRWTKETKKNSKDGKKEQESIKTGFYLTEFT